MIFNNNFVLASSSESRYNILKNIRLSFTVIKPKCNENFFKKKLVNQNTPTKIISLELARFKAKSVSNFKKNTLIVGLDTAINFKGKMLNKANNIDEAKKTIIEISGKKHSIYSSVSVFNNKKEIWNTSQKSTIKIRKLTEREIDTYLLKTGKKILNSVGCYQAELLGPNIIEEIKGDFFNVMGFPLFPFLIFLKKYKKTAND